MCIVWLDDSRTMPEGYEVHVKTAEEAIKLLMSGEVSFISLDHDLGDGNGSGSQVALYIEEHAWRGTLNRLAWRLHTANPVGREYMHSCLSNADRYWTRHGH
jgi:hypothetical protein